jgi:EmrB/QacA subfamily drug resistance transporter
LSLLVVVVDSTIVNVALPTLVRELRASTTSLQWVVDAYSLAVAGLLLTLGSLGDRIGRHKTLAGGLVAFGLGSGLAAVSGSADQLIACRVLMGMGAAAILPATLSILTNVFTDGSERAKAISAWAAVSGLGIAIGPTLGGWLLEHFSWGSIFLINLPIVLVALVAGHFLVPSSADEHPATLDPAGALLSVVGLVALVYAIIEAPNYGWLSFRTVGVGLAGVIFIGAFVAWELHVSHPMVNLRIFRQARFSAASFTLMTIFLSLFGWLFLFTQQLQVVLGYDALQAGVRALPFALTIGIVSPLAASLAARFGTKVVLATGMGVMSAGLVMAASSTVGTHFSFLLVASIVIAFGMGLALAPATESIMGSLARSQAGAGSALNATTQQVGGVLGVAVLGSIALTVFRSRLQVGHLPVALGDRARASVGAAVAIGHLVPKAAGHAVIASAYQAFVIGADRATLLAAGAASLGSVVTGLFLPARAALSAPDAPTPTSCSGRAVVVRLGSEPVSGILREAQVDAPVARVQPTARHDLAAGEEMHAFGAMGVRVTEQRALPATE